MTVDGRFYQHTDAVPKLWVSYNEGVFALSVQTKLDSKHLYFSLEPIPQGKSTVKLPELRDFIEAEYEIDASEDNALRISVKSSDPAVEWFWAKIDCFYPDDKAAQVDPRIHEALCKCENMGIQGRFFSADEGVPDMCVFYNQERNEIIAHTKLHASQELVLIALEPIKAGTASVKLPEIETLVEVEYQIEAPDERRVVASVKSFDQRALWFWARIDAW